MSDLESFSPLSEWEIDVLKSVNKIGHDRVLIKDDRPSLLNQGWTTSASVREALGSKSLPTRTTLRRLSDWGFLQLSQEGQVQFFRVSNLGNRALNEKGKDAQIVVTDAQKWTGVMAQIQVHQVLQIVSEIEDICETILENEARSQIIGLVRALEILLELPNPPKQGIVELVRDPAFANILQIATCLAAIIAAVKA